MDITSLKRDANSVKMQLAYKDGQYIAKSRLRILVPAYFETKGLLSFGTEIYFLGFYCILTEDNTYAIDISPAMIRTAPSQITRVDIEDMEYVVLVYDRGDLVIADENVVKDENVCYKIFNEILAKGLFPWWMNYEDRNKLFSKTKKFTGSKVGDNFTLYEIIVSALSRDPSDKTIQYRQGLKSKTDLITRPPVASPLRSVQYSASNTVAKLAGSYFQDGLISAINDPTTRVERGERILRL